jgi:hypothetical protein
MNAKWYAWLKGLNLLCCQQVQLVPLVKSKEFWKSFHYMKGQPFTLNGIYNLTRFFFFFFFFFNFVMYPHWKSSTRGISQIWLQVKEESRKFNTFTAFCQPAGTCCLNMAIKRKTQNLATSVFFFWQKSFYMRCIGFFIFFS